jgi:hypothetical protein
MRTTQNKAGIDRKHLRVAAVQMIFADSIAGNLEKMNRGASRKQISIS